MNKFNKIFIRSFKTFRTPSVSLLKIDRIQQDEKVLKPFMHIQRAPSKFHLALYRSFDYWLQVPDDKKRAIEDVIQTFHSATLMIDDIQDNSTFRYQVPVAHVVYSLALTINAACHAMCIAVEKMVALEPKAIDIYLEAVIENHRGQGIDIFWRDNLICPSEEEYIDMINQKTSVMFVMACQLHQLFSHNKTDYTKLASLIGVYYQIRDDYCNLIAEKHTDNKTYCSDITEGKFSLPIIHAVQNSDSASQLINILKQRTQDPDLKGYCISLLQKNGSLEYTREMINKLEANIHDEHTDNKTYCSDITEGIFSLPIIHAVQNSDSASQLINILKQRTQDPDLKGYCISLLQKNGSLEYTREMINKLEANIHDEIARFGGNPELTAVMEKLGNWRKLGKD